MSNEHLYSLPCHDRTSRRGDRGQRSPTNRRQQLQQASADDEDEDEDDVRMRHPYDKFAEMQKASRRLERKLPELERRFLESSVSRQDVRNFLSQ